MLGGIDRLFVSAGCDKEGTDSVRSYACSLVCDAAVVLPADPALGLFEQQDPAVLIRRIETLEYLLDEYTPFYTLNELANHLDSFLMFLAEHKDLLVRTGLPPKPFPSSPWLDAHLARLYDTRDADRPHSATKGLSNALASAPLSQFLQSLTRDERECGYDGVYFLPGISGADGCRVETLRPAIFEAKMALVGLIAEAARRGRCNRLWTDCLRVLTSAFRADDVQFLFKMDRLSFRSNLLGNLHERTHIHRSPGGLTNLLIVAGHAEKELTLRTLSGAKAALGDIRKLVSERNGSAGVTHPYLLLIGRPETSQIDRALDNVAQLGDRDREFWDDFRERVRNDCRREFIATVEVLVPAKHRDRLAPLLSEDARHLLARLEKGESRMAFS